MSPEVSQFSNSPELLVANLQMLPFPDCSFDVVLCLGVLEYTAPGEQVAAVAEISRVLKPGGWLILSCLNQRSPYWRWKQRINRQFGGLKTFLKGIASGNVEGRQVQPVLAREFSEDEIRCLLYAQNLSVTKAQYYGFNTFLPPFDAIFPRLALWIGTKLEHKSEGRLSHWSMAFIVVAQKDGNQGAAGEPTSKCCDSYSA